MAFKVVIPSYAREKLIIRSVVPTLPGNNIYVVVFHEEVERYRKYLDLVDEERRIHVVGIDSSIRGLRLKMDWIVQNLWEPNDEFIFKLDDDIAKFYWAMGEEEITLSGADIINVVQDTAEMAKMVGSRVFGFMHLNKIQHAKRTAPFSFRRTVGGCYGMLDRSIRYNDKIEHAEDIDYSLWCMFRDGITFTNGMVCFKTLGSIGTTPGGCAAVRTTKGMQEANARLLQKYGSFAQQIYMRTKEHKVNIM